MGGLKSTTGGVTQHCFLGELLPDCNDRVKFEPYFFYSNVYKSIYGAILIYIYRRLIILYKQNIN